MPSFQADYEKITAAIESDFALQFCSHRWIENARAAERVENILEKYLKIIDFGKLCQKVSNHTKASLELTRVMILC